MSCSKSFHQTAFHVKGSCCATCHGKHVGLLHVTFGPSVRSCSARHWMFFEIHVSEVESLVGTWTMFVIALSCLAQPSLRPPTNQQQFLSSQRNTFETAQLMDLNKWRSRCGKKWTKYFTGTWKLGCCPSDSSWKWVKDVAGVSCWADFRRSYHAEFLCRNRLGCCFMKPISCTWPETSRWCR